MVNSTTEAPTQPRVNVTSEAPSQIRVSVTTEAASQLREILERQDRVDLAVRLFVQAAQGNKVAYGMGLDDNRLEDDQLVEMDGLRFLVDPDSAPYV